MCIHSATGCTHQALNAVHTTKYLRKASAAAGKYTLPDTACTRYLLMEVDTSFVSTCTPHDHEASSCISNLLLDVHTMDTCATAEIYTLADTACTLYLLLAIYTRFSPRVQPRS